jgi:hypothetical protein
MGFQPGPHGSRVVHHAGPWIQGCASCWPMDPWLCILPAIESRVVHRVPSRGDRSCWPWFADVLQMYADVCILLAFVCRRSPNVCRRLHTAGLCLQTFSKCMQTFAYCWPLFADVLQMYADVCILLALNPGLCILLALGSGIVHTSGHWIQGCASSPLPWGSQLLARSALITRWDSNRPAGDRSCKPSRSR